MHPMVRLTVRRHGNEFVDEPIAVTHISRISPPTPGEKADYGCRVSLSTQPVTLQVKQGPDEVVDLMVRAQVDLALAMAPELTAELVSEQPPEPGRFVMRGTTKWQHQTRGTHYRLLGFAKVQSATSINEGDELAVYIDLAADGLEHESGEHQMWCRPHAEFLDGRFVRHGATSFKHPDGFVEPPGAGGERERD